VDRWPQPVAVVAERSYRTTGGDHKAFEAWVTSGDDLTSPDARANKKPRKYPGRLVSDLAKDANLANENTVNPNEPSRQGVLDRALLLALLFCAVSRGAKSVASSQLFGEGITRSRFRGS